MELDDLIELLEGELSQEEVQSMELLFRHSINDRRAFLNLSRLRDAVEGADPIKNLKSIESKRLSAPDYQKNLSEKIMKGIREQSESVRLKRKRTTLKPLLDPSHS